MTGARPEAWLRGAMDGFDPLVMPIAFSLIQAREDIEALAETLSVDQVWATPGGAASVGFHVRHLGGALDRLCTYARGEQLSDEQKALARQEHVPGDPLTDVLRGMTVAIENALRQLQATHRDDLLTPRGVGRAMLPSTTLGLLVHAAEHCTRHAGQAITTAKILQGAGA